VIIVGKGIRIVGGLLNAVTLKPVLNQMKKERKLEVKLQNSRLNQAALDVLAERAAENSPRVWDVRQPFDSIIHRHEFW